MEGVLTIDELRSVASYRSRWTGRGVAGDERAGIKSRSARSNRGCVAGLIGDVARRIARLKWDISREFDGRPGLELVDGIKDEAAQKLIHETAVTETKHFVAAEGKLVGATRGEVVGVVEG